MGGQYLSPVAPTLQANARTMTMDKYTIEVVASNILQKYVGKDVELFVSVDRDMSTDQMEMAVVVHRKNTPADSAPIFREHISPTLKGFPSNELVAKLMMVG